MREFRKVYGGSFALAALLLILCVRRGDFTVNLSAIRNVWVSLGASDLALSKTRLLVI